MNVTQIIGPIARERVGGFLSPLTRKPSIVNVDRLLFLSAT